jgi:hypothetical protein
MSWWLTLARNRSQARLVYIVLAGGAFSRAVHECRSRDDHIAVLVNYCHTNTFLSKAEPNMAKILIITFLKVPRVDIAGHVLGKSWTNIYALTEVIRGLPFARIWWRSLAKTTSVGMLQSQVAGPSRRESGRWC